MTTIKTPLPEKIQGKLTEYQMFRVTGERFNQLIDVVAELTAVVEGRQDIEEDEFDFAEADRAHAQRNGAQMKAPSLKEKLLGEIARKKALNDQREEIGKGMTHTDEVVEKAVDLFKKRAKASMPLDNRPYEPIRLYCYRPEDIASFLTEFLATAQSAKVEEVWRETIKIIEKEAAEVYMEMLGAIIDQQGLKVQDYTLVNTAMIQHILTGTIGNLSTRLSKALSPTPAEVTSE